MPIASLSSAPVTFLDVPRAVEAVRAAAIRLRATDPGVVAVILFGSLADGTATPRSDADVLVVLREDGRRVLDRIPDYTRPFEDLDLSVQVLPWTRGELERRLAEGDRFAREIVERGRVLAGAIAFTSPR